MLVYGDARRIEDPRKKAAAIRDSLDQLAAAEPWFESKIERHALVAGLLVEAGELEQGLLDWIGDERPSDLRQAASRLTRAVAELLLHSFRTLGSPPGTAAVTRALDDLLACDLPAMIEVSIPEGYAVYGLYPESYFAAAELVLDSLAESPLRVIGIRSIGTGLAAVVAAVAGPAATVVNVRPTGHPFSRQLILGPQLEQALLAGGDSALRYAIVDEGPGLSGSSFGCVADWLEDHGVASESITFFPSHRGDPGPHAAERHRERWHRACRPVAEFETLFAMSEACAASDTRWPLASWVEDLTGKATEPLEDLSAGRWREKLISDRLDRALWPAADTQGERRKYLLTAKSGTWLLKFAGLGRYGRETLELAKELDGLIPPVAGLRHGFLAGPWLAGARPLPLVPDLDRSTLLAAVASYLARRASRLPADPHERGATPAQLFEMLLYNSGRALEAWKDRLPTIERRERLVLTDNKMHAWEWLVTPDGRILKADALDHHRGNDLVGPQDIAWDLAGAAIELDLDESELDDLAAQVARQSGTPRATRLQLDFYTLAYLAFQTGRSTLAAEAVERSAPAESAALRAEAARYADRLRRSGCRR